MIEIPAKIKRFGGKKWEPIRLRLPDGTKQYTDEYDIELVEFPGAIPYVSIFVFEKGNTEEDVASHTVYRQNAGDNMSQGFKNIFEQLKKIEKKKQQALKRKKHGLIKKRVD